MNGPCQQIGQPGIDRTLAFQAVHPGKDPRHDPDVEVGFAARLAVDAALVVVG